jgi:hypothetical protein
LFFEIETALQKRRFGTTGGGGDSVEQFIIRWRVNVSEVCPFQLTTRKISTAQVCVQNSYPGGAPALHVLMRQWKVFRIRLADKTMLAAAGATRKRALPSLTQLPDSLVECDICR